PPISQAGGTRVGLDLKRVIVTVICMANRDFTRPYAPGLPPAGEPFDSGRGASDAGIRAPEIDAIRGWAALSVVCFHVFWETFGVVVPELRNPYTAGLLAGHFDVILFFILSGDALSFPFFHGGGLRYLRRAALKRYPRLTVPIVVVTAVVALAMAAGITPTTTASEIVDRTDWLGSFARFNPAGASAVRFALFYVYQGDFRADYLPFLWTMPIELMGSFVLLLVLFVQPTIRGAGWAIAGLAVVLLRADIYAGCFLVGLLLGWARARGLYTRLPVFIGRRLAPLGIVAALILAGRRQSSGDQTLWHLAEIGTLLLFSIYACPPVVRWLSRNRLSQFLGRISYLLYLWHFVVLITLTSRLIVQAAGQDGSLAASTALAIGGLTVAVSVLVSWWTLPIEGWARTINIVLLRARWREDGPQASDAATAEGATAAP
ncbi:MAG: acyltransferase family protein, partial [Janthinobacterium lividum]